MGMSMMSKCSCYPPASRISAPNPDPLNFKILATKQVWANLVAKIEYPDCTNFDGVKVCVFRDMNIATLFDMEEVDPHFADKSTAPFARFKPTQEGWDAAVSLAEVLGGVT